MTTRSTKKQKPQQPHLTTPAELKAFIRNILLTTPVFTGLYEKLLISEGYNPQQVKQLVDRYQKIKEAENMPVHPNVKTCTHIKVTGIRCGSPALREEQFCYFHQRMMRGVRTPPFARLHPIAMLENEESVQASLMEIINALVRNTVDPQRAELVLRALNAAIRNSRRVRFDAQVDEMVKQVPEYTLPPRPQGTYKSGPIANPGPPISEADDIYEFTEPKMYLDDPPPLKKPGSTAAVSSTI
jgi:hypothetical protein